MIIGICGKSGSGKSTLARELKNIYGDSVVHLDIDKVGHRALALREVQEELSKTFGSGVIDDDKVDRKKLGEIVFVSRLEMKKLSDITWKYMEIEIDRFLDEHEGNIVVLDWLLLPSTKFFSRCDKTILLDIPYEIRKERAMARDSITSEAFDLREKASINFNLDDFDYVLSDNNCEIIEKTVKLV